VRPERIAKALVWRGFDRAAASVTPHTHNHNRVTPHRGRVRIVKIARYTPNDCSRLLLVQSQLVEGDDITWAQRRHEHLPTCA
jgi:hypothetical protein